MYLFLHLLLIFFSLYMYTCIFDSFNLPYVIILDLTGEDVFCFFKGESFDFWIKVTSEATPNLYNVCFNFLLILQSSSRRLPTTEATNGAFDKCLPLRRYTYIYIYICFSSFCYSFALFLSLHSNKQAKSGRWIIRCIIIWNKTYHAISHLSKHRLSVETVRLKIPYGRKKTRITFEKKNKPSTSSSLSLARKNKQSHWKLRILYVYYNFHSLSFIWSFGNGQADRKEILF